MSSYAKKTWVNGVDAANASNLQHIEDGIAAVPGIYFLATPYHLTTNPTVNSGSSTNLTCTGVGSIPASGVTAVIIGGALYSVTAGGTINIYPTGGTAGKYVNITPQWAGNNVYTGLGTVFVPVSAGGQITAAAVNQNMILQDWYIYAYII